MDRAASPTSQPESFTNWHRSRLSLGPTRNISSVGRKHRYATPSVSLVKPISCAISAPIDEIFGLCVELQGGFVEGGGLFAQGEDVVFPEARRVEDRESVDECRVIGATGQPGGVAQDAQGA